MRKISDIIICWWWCCTINQSNAVYMFFVHSMVELKPMVVELKPMMVALHEAETASVAGARNYETSRHERAASILSLIMCVRSLGPLFCLLIDKVGGRIPFCVGELILFTDRLRRQICSFNSELHKMTMICRLCHADAHSRKFPKDYGSLLE